MKKILVTGNLGYVGPSVIRFLRNQNPTAEIFGFDAGFFIGNLTYGGRPSETLLNAQYYGDTRSFPYDILEGIDVVVHLAAVSNDPIGNKFEDVTHNINYLASVELAKQAKNRGVKHFVFASSCSIYGKGGNNMKTEYDTPNPLTAYAKSKIMTEEKLDLLADNEFIVTSLRFATACGYSERCRLDLVLNDFVASAISSGRIEVLSDGMPWRPLISVNDMARAMGWAAQRALDNGGPHLVINTGSNDWNYRVLELGKIITDNIPNIELKIANTVQSDDRSYRVNFDKFNDLAKGYLPESKIEKVVMELWEGLKAINFHDQDFRKSTLCRLIKIEALTKNQAINNQLGWAGVID